MTNIWQSLVGLKILAIKGTNYDYKPYGSYKKVKKEYIEPQIIFFEDEETYIQLEEQDYYTYHDCSSSARNIRIVKDKKSWKNLFNSPDYSDSNDDL